MDNKKRIIELVEKGVLSTEEALKLLENIAEKEAEQAEEVNFTSKNTVTVKKEHNTSSNLEIKQEPEDKKTAETDNLSEEIKKLDARRKESEEKVKVFSQKEKELKKQIEEISQQDQQLKTKQLTKINELQEEIKQLETEIQLVQEMHQEVDASSELVELFDQLSTNQRLLEKLEVENEIQEKTNNLPEKLVELQEELAQTTEEKASVQKELHRIKMQLWSNKAYATVNNIEVPENWAQNMDETVKEAGNTVGSAISQIGGVVGDVVDKISGAVGDFEWTDAKSKIQKGIVSETITQEWTFSDPEITVLDFKNANGKMKFYQGQTEEIKIKAQMRMYGLLEEDLKQALNRRMEIEETQGQLRFHIPNKKVQAHLEIWLPERTYDYLFLRLLNGDVTFEPLKVKDITLNVTNGQINFDQLDATLLELKGTNGNIKLNEASLRDLIINTVSGDVRIVGAVQNSQISTVNGSVRQTLYNEDVVRITNQTVNGTIKVAFPKNVGLEGHAQTTFGHIHTRLSQFNEDPLQVGKVKELNIIRSGDSHTAVELKTIAGSIFIKDNDNEENRV